MNKKRTRKRLQATPWDSELCVMIGRLTGHVPEIVRFSDDTYLVDVSINADFGEDYFEAVRRAIKGRAGERFVRFSEVDEDGCFAAYIKYSEDAPEGYAIRAGFEPDFEAGIEFVQKDSVVRATQFDPEFPTDRLMQFIGGGEVSGAGPEAVLTFDSGAGVFLKARAGDYIVHGEGGFFKVIPADEFECQFVPR